jgi:hypothetical protein
MISLNKFTQSCSLCLVESMVIIGSIAISILTPNLASAKDFKIGSVKQQFDFGGMCVSLLPKTQKYMLVIPFPSSKSQPTIAWINIDGKDLSMR